MRVVFDTNVYIAAALTGEFARTILQLAEKRVINLLTSEEILKELWEKLISKFDKSEENVDLFVKKILNIAEIVKVTENIFAVKRDPEDNKILECAVAGNADLIVSSDQDLIKLKKFRGIAIVHPKTLSYTFPNILKRARNKVN